MAKPLAHPYSQYSLNALLLLGQPVREARLARALTTTDWAVRAGISRSLLQRIERGDPGCSIGAVLEVAAICGAPLLESDARWLSRQLGRQVEKMALYASELPLRARAVAVLPGLVMPGCTRDASPDAWVRVP